ncbi:MAG: RNA polymerase sigma factor (sigma-70 family) [Verrucomicrobiales bacterium]
MTYQPFPQTRWTLVLSAKAGEASNESAKALEELARAYWRPVYAYLRGKGHSHEDAQDHTQGLFAQLLKRDFLQNLEPSGGRFRSYLLVSLRHRLIDHHDLVANRQRRAEISIEPWHDIEPEKPYPLAASPEEAFDRTWAESLIARAMSFLEERWSNRPELFAELRYTVESPGNVAKHADIATKLGMTEGGVSKAAFDFRQQFAEQIRKEVRDTVASDDDVDDELRYLVRLLHK